MAPPGTYNADVSPSGVAQHSDGNQAAGYVGEYDALQPKGRRRSVTNRIRSEDVVLTQAKRQRLNANAMDLHRNFGLVGWALRRHLEYVTLNDFCATTSDRGLNRDLETLMARDSQPERCDVGGRHGWEDYRELAEVRKELDGDCGLMRLRSMHIDGVESHELRNPTGRPRDRRRWTNGVLLNKRRRAIAYNVVTPDDRGRNRDREVPARNLFLHANFAGRFRQVRGISNFTAAMNEFRDLYEAFDYTRARIKVEQLIGLVLTRKAEKTDESDPIGKEVGATVDPDADEVCEDSEKAQEPRKVSFGDGGPALLDLDDDEDAKFIQGGTPSATTTQFLQLTMMLALCTFDIPYNFLDPSFVNFAGGRNAWIGYERTTVIKRRKQYRLNRWHDVWRFRQWLLPKAAGGTGELVLPRGIDFDDLLRHTDRKPRGVPWWKPQEELNTELQAIAAGLDTWEAVSMRHNLGDVRDNIDANAAVVEYAKERGFTLQYSGKQPIQIVTAGGDDG